MPELDGPQWNPDPNVHWTENWRRKLSAMRESENIRVAGPIREWYNSSFFSPARFPTRYLMSRDTHLQDSEKYWDPNPAVARRQKALDIPKDAPSGQSSSHAESHEEFMHESFKGTGAPSHVTVYHHGDIPKDARYASGSVDPNWPEAVRRGWRSTDPSVNKGRLHIYLVPHGDILEEGGAEGEVFFRRGQSLNRTKRTRKRQWDVLNNSFEKMQRNWVGNTRSRVDSEEDYE